ncbi:MAG: pseudouridine-5'-phosphate glycosidase [Oligoflexales bacterium]|nr:pseudouridine-5'-phosphate glycosidase [Oligoflexales bacterium]
MRISDEVNDAINTGKPVVALESTIIAHGMPYPENLKVGLTLENIIRKNGAVPATTAIIDGKITIGLSSDHIEMIASSKNVIKVSIRDFPYVMSQKKIGATTVAGTLFCCQLAKIRVFVTGGIGGVHREAQTTMDISADLLQISNTDTAVVSAGVKSILDIPKTLEYLETLGVPVLGYQTDEFPAFYTRTSGEKVLYRMNSPEEIADFLNSKWSVGLKGGVLVSNPIPHEKALDEDLIGKTIEEALKEAHSKGIRGKNITPFLLDYIVKATKGASLDANIALVCNNAELGARISREYCSLTRN